MRWFAPRLNSLVFVHAASNAARDILRNALDQLGPTFAEVFERLAPNPAFTELVARQDVMRIEIRRRQQ